MSIPRTRTVLRLFLLSALVVPVGCGGAGEDAAPSPPVVVGEPLGVAGAHEHGVATLGVAVDGALMTVDLAVPAASVFGFERAPRTNEEIASMTASLERLRSGVGDLIALPDGVACGVDSVDVFDAPEIPSEPVSGSGEDDDHAHEHDEDEADDHDPAAADDHADDYSDDDEAEQAGDAPSDDGHDDVRVVATLRCDSPPSGTARLNLTPYLADLEVVDLTVVTAGGQAAARVSAQASFEL